MLSRKTEYCFKCGKPMKEVYNKMPEDWYGDSFSHHVHDGKCIGKTKKYKDFIKAVKPFKKKIKELFNIG